MGSNAETWPDTHVPLPDRSRSGTKLQPTLVQAYSRSCSHRQIGARTRNCNRSRAYRAERSLNHSTTATEHPMAFKWTKASRAKLSRSQKASEMEGAKTTAASEAR